MASKAQDDAQAPHLMHFSTSMECTSLTLPEIAPTGQTRAQRVQPLHLDGLT